MEPLPDRRGEWFVPTFGPLKFRLWVGLLFLPYTGMVVSFTMIGGMLADRIDWTRAGAIALIYFLGLGVAAHALDAVGGKGAKPWGRHFSRRRLWAVALAALVPAYAIGLYYIVTATPRLAVIALLEGFFLFAYNLEWFEGRFHTDRWFAFSWGCLPVLAGYVIQTGTVSIPPLFVAGSMGLLSLVEINASRPYKALKRSGGPDSDPHLKRYEAILKSISFGVILLSAGMVLWRWVSI